MGRGRAKAKQTKVARELKYNTGSLDPDRLKRELEAGGFAPSPAREDSDETEADDPYVDPYATDEDDEDDTAAR